MQRLHPLAAALLAASLLSDASLAQSFNLDIGAAGTPAPSATYAGAGQAGTWNAVALPHTTPSQSPQVFDEMLVDLAGNPTSVGVHQFGGMSWIANSEAGLTGDDAALLGDALMTFNPGLDSCLYLTGLENGTYEVIAYMYLPGEPSAVHKSLYDFTAGVQTTTGSWSGQHVEGVTYTRATVNVFNGFMGPHMGIGAGGSSLLGGAVNGLQLRKLECTSASFCGSTANSTGSAAVISSNGDCSIAANAFRLEAGPVPNTVGLFFYSQVQAGGGAGVPFGNGLRCVGGGAPLFRLGASAIDGNLLGLDVDVTSPPQAAGALTPGSTWHFQAWFRDPSAGGAQFDLSDGLSVTFGA